VGDDHSRRNNRFDVTYDEDKYVSPVAAAGLRGLITVFVSIGAHCH